MSLNLDKITRWARWAFVMLVLYFMRSTELIMGMVLLLFVGPMIYVVTHPFQWAACYTIAIVLISTGGSRWVDYLMKRYR